MKPSVSDRLTEMLQKLGFQRAVSGDHLRLPPTQRPPRITLALGGGGARGVAHLGVIEVLRDRGFEIERIVGVSSGSLAGAMYALEPDIALVQKRALGYLLSPRFQEHQRVLFGAHPSLGTEAAGGVFAWYDRVKTYLAANRLFRRVVGQSSLLPGVIPEDVVDHLLPDADIADAKIPLCVVTVDLRTGHNIVLERGPVRKAVRASMALPGIFPPVEIDGMLLSDLGVFYSLPTTIARGYRPQFLVAVDVGTALKPIARCETALDVLFRMDEIGEALFRKHVIDVADFVIRPEVCTVEWFDFSNPERLIAAGRTAAVHAMARLADMHLRLP